MAKQQKFSLNDFQFDKNLDVPDFDFDLKPPKDNRKPITKLGSGLKEGVGLSVKNSAFVKNVIEKALPKGYGSAYDLGEKSFGSLKSLYDDTTKEIRPFMNDLKRTTARLLPKVEQAMPDKLAKQVKAWTETADQNPNSPHYDPREAEISEMLKGFATIQAQLQQKQTTEDDTKDRLREGLEQVRHRDKLKQMDSLRVGIAQLVDYQSNVTANYHRKSLELQYRHYFVAVDALEEAKRANAEMKQALAAIVHNTALPEQVKLHASDSFKAMAKRKAMGLVGGTILGRGYEFMNNFQDNLKRTALRSVKGVLSGGRTGLDIANGVLDADDMARAMGMETDPLHSAGMLGGALGTDFVSQWLAKKMAPHLAKMPGVKRFGNKLQYGVENVPQMLGEWARTSKGENGGLTDGLVRLLKMNIKRSQKLNTGLEKDTLESMGDAHYFSKQSAKSLNEIIPGYLARILREMQIMRTGDQNTELVHYDYTKNRFDSQSNVRTNAFKSLVKDNERQWTTESVENLINEVTSKTGKTLTPEQRKALGSQLLRNNVKGRLGGVDVLGNRRRYDGSAADHADTFSDLFRSYFKNDTDNERKHTFANQYNALGQYASASREKVQHFVNLGMNDFLNEAGLLNKDEDGVELEKFFDYYYGGQYTPGSHPAAPGHHTFSGQPMQQKRASGGFAARPGARTPVGGLGKDRSQQTASAGLSGLQGNAVEQLLGAINVSAQHTERNVTTISDMIFDPEKKPSALSKILDVLTRMEERIQQGLPTFVVGNVADGSVPDAAVASGDAGSTSGKKKRWWNKSIKEGVLGLGGAAWGGARRAGKIANWFVGGGFGAVNALTRGVAGIAGRQASKAFDKMRGFKDVYSEETGPRKILLYGARLKAGEYFDVKTGKPIHTWKDIQGAVADDTGVVMTDEQAATAYVKDGMAKKLIRGLGAVAKPLAKLGGLLGGNILGGPLAGYRAIAKASAFAGKMLLNFANGPQDVYVFDKDHPKRLRKALDAKTMRAGGYTSAVNDKPIKGPKDIDGEVYNYKGVTVLDEEEFKRGLYDKNGNPIKHGIGRLLGGVGKIAGAVTGGLRWLAGGINQGIGNAFGLGKGLLGGFAGLFGKHGIFFGGGKKLLGTVEEIRDLLKDRLPQQHKIRKGSIEDQHNRRREAEEEARRGQGGQDGDEKKRGGILGMLAGLFKRKKKDKEDGDESTHGGLVDDIESGVGQAIGERLLGKIPGGKYLRKIPGLGRLFGKGGASAAAEAAEGAVGGAAKRGLGSRILGGLKWGKGLGAGLALGAAGSLANATGHTTIGKGLDYAGDAATGWSLASGAAGLLGVQGGALGLAGAAGGALLSGLGAIIASPVLLPALGIAAAGAAMYGGYKLLTRNKLDDLSKIRYAQYGWKPDDNSHVHAVFGFEQALMKGIVYQGGMAQLEAKKIDFKSAVEGLGVDLKDKEQVNAFATWYTQRFKPVFITHLTVLNRIKPGVALSDADDKLKGAERKQYLDGITLPSGTYNVMVSPFSGEQQVSATADDVQALLNAAKSDAAKDTKDKKDDPTAKAGLDAAGKTAGAAVAAVGAADAVKNINDAAKGTNASALSTAGKAAGALAAGSAAAAGGALTGGAITMVTKGRVDAMEAIRFKTYGLKELDSDKVATLRQLEALVQADVKMSKDQAVWNGDTSDLASKIGPQFGFSGNRNNRAYDWMTWFSKRFLPTYLTYVTAVCKATDKKDPSQAMQSIKPDDLLTAAKQVVSATTSSYGMSTSVWQIPTSPWPDYELNSESASTDGNMAILKQQQKTQTVPEQTAFQKKTTAANDGDKNQSQDAKPKSWMDSAKDFLSNAWDKTKQFAGNVWQGAKDMASSAANAVGGAVSNAVSGAGDALKSGYNTAKLKVAGVSAALKGGMNTLASLISRGEGDYSIANKPVGGSYPVAKGVDVSKMTIGEIQKAQANRQIFAVGRYQLIPSTLAGAVKAMGLNGDMPFSPEVQDKIFAGYLVGSKRPQIAAYLSGKSDDVQSAALAAAQEWASIGTPKGMKNAHGQVSDGTTSYYAGIGGNKASISADEIMAAMTEARKDKTGTAPVNVAGTGGGAAGSDSGGFMKVADQTPGPAPAVKGSPDTSSTPSAAPAAGGSSGGSSGAAAAVSALPDSIDSQTAAAMGGFQNRNKDLAAQSQYQSDSLSKSLGPVSDVLNKSLDVQKQMLTALQQLVGLASKNGASGQPAPQQKAPTGTLSPDAMQRRQPKPMVSAPVSMAKTA